MISKRGKEHTTLTETAKEVVAVLKRIPGVEMVGPGIIKQNPRSSGKRHVTAVFTNAGMELIITGQGVQKVAVHSMPDLAPHIFEALRSHKRLSHISFKSRVRKPGAVSGTT